jgi:hypothetical protein
MHRLYLVLKDRKERPTADEITIAAGQKILDPTSGPVRNDKRGKEANQGIYW